ncbi:MAG: heme-binding protein [Celeribacter sp.]|jgi:uncharacterized protein GlcG (DUF336 family)
MTHLTPRAKFLPAAILALATLALPAQAQEDSPYVSVQVLKPEIAMQMAQAAMTHCRDQGYQVGVSVVDRFGTLQMFVKDRYAGLHVQETSFRKAWTAVSFRTDTHTLDTQMQAGSDAAGLRHLSQVLPVGGGLVVEGGGQMVGAIGISGAPSPELDVACAEAGIEAVADAIAF